MDPTRQSFPPWPCIRGPRAEEIDFMDTYVNIPTELIEILENRDLNRDHLQLATR